VTLHICERQPHHIFPHDQQGVSNISYFWEKPQSPSPYIFSYDQQVVSCIAWFCERQFHHIFSYDQQVVSDTSHFCDQQSHHIFSYDQQGVSDVQIVVKGRLITSFYNL